MKRIEFIKQSRVMFEKNIGTCYQLGNCINIQYLELEIQKREEFVSVYEETFLPVKEYIADLRVYDYEQKLKLEIEVGNKLIAVVYLNFKSLKREIEVRVKSVENFDEEKEKVWYEMSRLDRIKLYKKVLKTEIQVIQERIDYLNEEI